MGAIFVCYRRDDAEGQAGRLFDDLTRHFGENTVFIDVESVAAGRDFRRVIEEQVASCNVLLVVIGKGWLDANDESGRRRLEDPGDFVRLEIASALKRDIPVVPVLVQGARMPRKEALPKDLAELAFRNGVELTHARWDSDLQMLIKSVSASVKSEHKEPGPGWPHRLGAWRAAGAGLLVALVIAIAGYAWYEARVAEQSRLESRRQAAEQRRVEEEQRRRVETAQSGIHSYPMTCRGGGELHALHSASGVQIRFQPGEGPATGGLRPGQCTWSDRALGSGEPRTICDEASRAATYLPALASGQYAILQVYNDGRGCMRVTRVGP